MYTETNVNVYTMEKSQDKMVSELNLQLNQKTNVPQHLYSFPYAALPLLETPVDTLLI